jgi:hypothetical protein
MWLRYFLTAPTSTTRGLLRDHLSAVFSTTGLLDKVRDSLPVSTRARLLYDLLVVELALELGLQVDQAYIDRCVDVSPLITKVSTDGQ